MAVPRPPQQLRAKRTRRKLLAAARRVFAESGYEGATVDDIACAAGCSKGAYYFHFASKEDALLVLVDQWTRERSRRLAEAGGARSPDGALAGLLEALFSSQANDTWEPRLLLEFWSQGERNPRVARRLAQAYRSWRRLLAQAFRRAQETSAFPPAALPAAAADAALALSDGLAVQTCLASSAGASAQGRVRAALALLAGPRALRRAG